MQIPYFIYVKMLKLKALDMQHFVPLNGQAYLSFAWLPSYSSEHLLDKKQYYNSCNAKCMLASNFVFFTFYPFMTPWLPQDLVSCFEELRDEGAFLRHHAEYLLPSLLTKQTSARVTVTQNAQSAALHSPRGSEEFLAAQQLLKESVADMKLYADATG